MRQRHNRHIVSNVRPTLYCHAYLVGHVILLRRSASEDHSSLRGKRDLICWYASSQIVFTGINYLQIFHILYTSQKPFKKKIEWWEKLLPNWNLIPRIGVLPGKHCINSRTELSVITLCIWINFLIAQFIEYLSWEIFFTTLLQLFKFKSIWCK